NGFRGDSNRVIVDWIKKDTTVSYDEQPSIWWDTRNVMFATAAQSASLAKASPGVGGSMARFTLLNNYLYTVTNSALNVFNVTEPENPVLSNTLNVGWNIETIYPFKSNLFIGSQNGIFIYNTANPARPAQVSRFSHITSCDPVIADDNFAYITLRAGTLCNGTTLNQLDVLDIENLQSPTFVKSYPLTNPHGLSKSGNTLIVCDGADGLKVFDASNPRSLKFLQKVGDINAYDVIAQNNLAIVVAADGLYQYEFSNPANLVFKSKLGVNKR
ncbi:MAG TPA: hypothetical protein VF540_07760, partial [Segetibacter sp.]